MEQEREGSGLQMHSVGVVVKDSATGKIEVSPLEKLNTQEAGQISTKEREMEATLPGEKSEAVIASVKSKNTIVASWLAVTGGNRVTAPHMFKNEMVMLWRFANDPQYFWTRLNTDNPGLRRAERATYKWSNADAKAKSVLSDLGYTLDVNAVEGYVMFTTDKGGNEKVVSKIRIDLKAGAMDIELGKVKMRLDAVKESVTVTAKTVLVDAKEVTMTGDLIVKGKASAKSFAGGSVTAGSGSFGDIIATSIVAGSISTEPGTKGGEGAETGSIAPLTVPSGATAASGSPTDSGGYEKEPLARVGSQTTETLGGRTGYATVTSSYYNSYGLPAYDWVWNDQSPGASAGNGGGQSSSYSWLTAPESDHQNVNMFPTVGTSSGPGSMVTAVHFNVDGKAAVIEYGFDARTYVPPTAQEIKDSMQESDDRKAAAALDKLAQASPVPAPASGVSQQTPAADQAKSSESPSLVSEFKNTV